MCIPFKYIFPFLCCFVFLNIKLMRLNLGYFLYKKKYKKAAFIPFISYLNPAAPLKISLIAPSLLTWMYFAKMAKLCRNLLWFFWGFVFLLKFQENENFQFHSRLPTTLYFSCSDFCSEIFVHENNYPFLQSQAYTYRSCPSLDMWLISER